MAESPTPAARLGQQIVSGVAASLSSYVATRGLNLLVTVLLARMLAPEGMGVVAASLLMVELIDTWRDFGLRDALIYKHLSDPVVPSTAFALIMTAALAQALLLLAIAPLAPLVVEDAVIVSLLVWLSLLFPINALGSVQDALLQKQLKFVRRGLADVLGAVVKLVATYALLLGGFGLWSMVWGILAAAATRTVAVTMFQKWRPEALPSWRVVGQLMGYGKHIVLINMLSPVRTKMDQLAVTMLMGDSALGLYFIASRIPELVIYGVNGILTRVAFPAFVIIAHDRDALGRAYLATTKWCLVLMAPVSIGLAATADQTIPLVFGPAWEPAVPVLICLAIGGVPLTIGWTAGDVFKATGRPHLLKNLVLLEIVLTAPMVWFTAIIMRDVFWVAAAMVVIETLSAFLRLYFMRRFGNLAILGTLVVIAPPLVAAAAMGVVVWLFSIQGFLAPGWIHLSITVAIGIVFYVAALMAIDYQDLRDGVQRIFRNPAVQ